METSMKTKYMYSAEKWNGGWIGILLYDKNYKSHGNVEILHSEKELADYLKNYPKTGVMYCDDESKDEAKRICDLFNIEFIDS